jgi:hypothetical protein
MRQTATKSGGSSLYWGIDAISLSVIPARNDEGGRSVGRFESQERKKINRLHSHLKIEPFNDFYKRHEVL